MHDILATFRPDLFADKRVLISGGTSGIGLALAKGFARLAADVTATGASQARLDRARADPEAKAVRFEALDVRDRKAVDAFVGGFQSLHALINAPGDDAKPRRHERRFARTSARGPSAGGRERPWPSAVALGLALIWSYFESGYAFPDRP